MPDRHYTCSHGEAAEVVVAAAVAVARQFFGGGGAAWPLEKEGRMLVLTSPRAPIGASDAAVELPTIPGES